MITCQATQGPSSQGWWRWREIDGRKCYYISRSRVGKSQLTWDPRRDTREVVVGPRKHYTPAELEEPKPAKLEPPAPPKVWTINSQNELADRLEGSFNSLKPVREILPNPIQVKEVKAVEIKPPLKLDPPVRSWVDFAPLLILTLILFMCYTVWRGIRAS